MSTSITIKASQLIAILTLLPPDTDITIHPPPIGLISFPGPSEMFTSSLSTATTDSTSRPSTRRDDYELSEPPY